MTQQIVERWAEMNQLSFMDAAKEIEILMKMYPTKKDTAATVSQSSHVE